ncbi:hypothetical protein SAMN05421781_0472 [Marinococcus luteus]|jgi:hypothetical protein|uniref:Uncharacterized protein n=1 Tax=Marinococcus luteus TaxID=1122204 RepID=A0A1H2QVE1_9BACI|nr:hypothetical protein [Marinococcus luteus]SDW10850.1 hypothetical protein SAMN05421781_0472 [Marinococcus luteus]
MHAQNLKQAILTCLGANDGEMEMSSLVRHVTQTLPFPVHAKEISDSISNLEQKDAVKKVRSSSGSVTVVLQKKVSHGAGLLHNG